MGKENKPVTEKAQIKSRKRVQEHGEVFTAEREVKAMCDLVKDESERIESRVLEPACGDGNFLAEILNRKLATVTKCSGKCVSDWEKYSIVALSSLYGVDIMPDNAQECRDRLFKIWKEAHVENVGNEGIPEIEDAARYILNTNILCGDALTMCQSNGEPIVFAEWNIVCENYMKRRDFEFKTMLRMQDNGEQRDMFDSSEEYDKSTGAFLPQPLREYKPIQYWRVQWLTQ